MTRYIHEPFNITDTGLTLLQINPERAADLRKDSRYFGWLFYRHPDGQWVTLRKLSAAEIDEAQDQASDMNALDAAPQAGVVMKSKSSVRFA